MDYSSRYRRVPYFFIALDDHRHHFQLLKLKDKGEFFQCCVIAAILDDRKTAEEMMWAYKKKDEDWFNKNYDGLRITIGDHNPEARFHLMEALQKQGYDVGLIAARLLEYFYVILTRGTPS